MSLINDALKRAKEAQQQNQPAASGPPLRPSESAQPQSGSGSKTLLYIMVACVVFGNVLLFFAVGWKESPKVIQPASASASATALTTNPAPEITTSVTAAPTTPAPVPQPIEIATNAAPHESSYHSVGSHSLQRIILLPCVRKLTGMTFTGRHSSESLSQGRST